MEQPLKQRLIGATIVISLAVIFVPMFIGNEPQYVETVLIEIPDAPESLESKILPLPEQSNDIMAEVKISKNQPVKVIKPKIPNPPKQKTVEVPNSWVIQMGSFSDKKNADNMAEQLKVAGYQAFVEKASVNNNEIFRVRVGPELSKESADRMSIKILKEQGVEKAIVIQYP